MLSVRESILGTLVGKNVLDFGSGAGRHAFWAFTLGADVVAVDLRFSELETAPLYFEAIKDKGEADGVGFAVQASGLHLPFAPGIFDVVIASEVFEHIADHDVAVREIARVIKPGGVLAVSVPRFYPEAVYWLLSDQYHNVPGGHIRIYKRSQLYELLSNAGFSVFASHHSHALHTPYWFIRCIVGIDNTKSWLYRVYHRFLVWDITNKPKVTAMIERMLNPVAGKSLVLYASRRDPRVD